MLRESGKPLAGARLMTRISILLLASCLGAAAGCSEEEKGKAPKTREQKQPRPNAPPQSQEELNTPLAKVDDVVITIGEFQKQLNRQSPYIRARYASMEQKKEFLDGLIRFEVLAKEALRRGFDKDPEVVRTMKQVMIQKLMKEEFELKLTPDAVTDAEMKTYYDGNLADYVKPEEVRASAVVLKSKAQATKVAAEAKGEAGKTNKGFRDLVTKYSVDEEGKLRGGDLRYFSRDSKDLPKAVINAAFALVQTGDVSGAIDGGGGKWYVLKQTGRRRAMTKSFEDAKPQIRNKLYRDKRIDGQNKFVADLRAKAKVQINEANLKKVRIESSTTTPDEGHGHMEPDSPVPGVPGLAPAPGAGSGAPGATRRRSERSERRCAAVCTRSCSCWPPPPPRPPSRSPHRSPRRRIPTSRPRRRARPPRRPRRRPRPPGAITAG